MTPTWIGVLMLLIGALLLVRGSVLAMLMFVMGSLLFGGSSALNLPALGGSSIQPAYVALGFLALRITLSGGGIGGAIARSLSLNWALVVFCLYGTGTALALPRIFRGAIEVTAMRFEVTRDPFATTPLAPTSQNITAGVYMIGTLLAAVCASVAARGANAAHRLAGAFAWLSLSHAALGLLVLGLTLAKQGPIIALVRNANYAQLDQSYGGFTRITGFFPEASAYAALGFALFVISLECWLRGVRPRLTGAAALAMVIMLLISTSSSAYLSLAGYFAVIVIRLMVFPSAIPPRRILTLFVAVFLGLLLGLIAAVALPPLLDAFADMLSRMTVEKATSYSGLQRQFWARQGLEAFQTSFGLGIGAGSFRSSSIATAILGSMGVVGAITMILYILQVLKPLRATTYGRPGLPIEQAFGASCGWAAILGLIPALAASPSPDPGLLFALLSGLSLAFRAQPAAVPPLRREQAATGPSLGVIPSVQR